MYLYLTYVCKSCVCVACVHPRGVADPPRVPERHALLARPLRAQSCAEVNLLGGLGAARAPGLARWGPALGKELLLLSAKGEAWGGVRG